MSPYLLDWIERGGVSWERVNMKSLGFAKESLDLFTLVDLAAVPDEDNVAGQVAQQMLQESNDPQSRKVLLEVKSEIEPQALAVGRNRKSPDDRNLVPAVAVPQYRSLPHGGPGLTNVGNEQEAAFVEKRQVGPESSSFFLYVARYNVSKTQSPCRFSGWPGVPVSGNSTGTPCAVISRRPPESSGPRDAFRSVGKSASTSIALWYGLPPEHPAPTTAVYSLSVSRINGKGVPNGCCEARLDLFSCASAAIVSQNLRTPSISAPQSDTVCRIAAWQWRDGAVAPVAVACHGVSCSTAYFILSDVSIIS